MSPDELRAEREASLIRHKKRLSDSMSQVRSAAEVEQQKPIWFSRKRAICDNCGKKLRFSRDQNGYADCACELPPVA